ncbi:MAG: hypothetical protein ACE5JP_02035 [Candidatus Bipolaricaulia bacterium]
MRRLTHREMLAAELFGYSYANYEDHLGIGNVRFEALMPREVDILEKAEREGWDKARIAQELSMPEAKVEGWLMKYREAKEIVDAPTLVQAFRRGVRQSIEKAVEAGWGDRASIERLVTQICYRAADLAYRLDMEGQRLSDLSEELREETEYDEEYWRKVLQREMGEEPETGEGAA